MTARAPEDGPSEVHGAMRASGGAAGGTRRLGTVVRGALTLAIGVGVVLAPAAASAQRPVRRPSMVPPRAAPPQAASAAPARPEAAGGLRGRIGVAVGLALVASDDTEERVRGVQRLGAIGTAEAVDALVAALDQGSPLMHDPRVRLEAIRALAPHVAKPPVLQILVRELTTPTPDARSSATPLAGLTRDTAALALARSGERKATTALVTALLQSGASATAAAKALRAYPPATLAPLLGEAKRVLAPALATFLGDLGDLRAIDRLRAALERGEIGVKLAAAVALAKLGDERPLALARDWVRRPDPRLLRTGAEVLAQLGAPDAPAAVARLLEGESTRADGLRLALAMPSPGLARPLAAAIPLLAPEDRGAAVAALGRAGGADAERELTRLLRQPALATAAAYALARVPGAGARGVLESALAGTAAKGGAARRLVVRAAVVRRLALGDAPEGLDTALESLLASRDASDRAVGAFGLVAIGARAPSELLAAKDEAVVRAAARGALARGPEALRACMPLLARAAALASIGEGGPGAAGGAGASPMREPSGVAVAAGVALLADPDGGPLSTTTLAAWAEGPSPLAPLAARALPSRDDEVVRPRIKRLLASSDPVVRAHAALGLGRDPERDAAAVLAGAYRFEEDAAVRRAIVRALSRRTEVQRRAVLELARDFDPDEGARALARAALAGRVLDHTSPATLDGEPAVTGPAIAWISILPNHASAARAAEARPARLARSDGLAVPVVADPDGVLVVPGLSEGAASVLLAPPAATGEPAP